MITSQQVKEVAKKYGADLVGIASMDRFEGAPKQFDPRYINPDAKAMIVVAFRIMRGCLRGIEEGTYFYSYSSMGYAAINLVYNPLILWNVCRFIEDHGYEATPIQNDNTWPAIDYSFNTGLRPNWSKPVSPDKPAPDVFVHFRIAAFCAGLGEIGYSKMFLTPEFGPRQRFAAILTEAPLEPDPIYEGPKLCDRCMLCVKECTGNAISPTETIKIKVAGREIEWGKLDEKACWKAFRFFDDTRRFGPFLGEPPEVYLYARALEGAKGCIRACMIHLEEQGKIKNLFKDKFRRRKPWKLE